MKRFVTLLLILALAVPLFALPAGAEPVYNPDTRTVYSEDHVGKKLADLTAGNDTAHTLDGKTPLDNLYDQKIVGSGYTDFPNMDGKQFEVTSKKLSLQGKHAGETTSKNLFSMSNEAEPNAGKGFLTVVPTAAMTGLDQFTVSYIERQYKPTGGAFGLALFYNAATEADGIRYFNGYDNFSFTGFTGNAFGTYAAYTLENGIRTDADCAAMTTKPARNKSVYVSVTCTKGTYTADGRTCTAKIESYVDDDLIAVSYGQWADAPVMFYYESNADRWDVQFTNITVTTRNAHLDTDGTAGTGVVYRGCQESRTADGSFGVRFIATVDSTDYSAVGFTIDAVYEAGSVSAKTYGRALNTVYTGLLATAADSSTVLVNAEALGGRYLMAYSITGIPDAVGTATFTVTPWFEKGGVRTAGTAYTVIYRAGVLIAQAPAV